MNALPVARSNDWLGSPSLPEAQPGGSSAFPDDASRPAPEAGSFAQDADPIHRLSAAQQAFLELRLEAALGRLAATETLLGAERLHARETQAALGVAERSLQRHRETIVAADQLRRTAAAEIERLKQGLHEAALEKTRQDHHIAALAAALAGKTAEIEELRNAGAAVESDLRASRTKHSAASDALQRECLRLEEALQGERRDTLLLQRALNLARANRRALEDQIRLQPVLLPPPEPRLALRGPARLDAIPAHLTALPSPQSLEHAAADAAVLLGSNGAHHAACR
ncbi:hypothetical protein [Bosea sp. 124]|uniref:hypothetical protein n=1 Tax=Bosea sp. 124 TaxID=2135642 RepID=UPI000D3A44B4|nr:hypothetical protein [Bosea sp. 124]PTM39756.1 hypothetical protein C8D03_1261 [Bosea sp. 124]